MVNLHDTGPGRRAHIRRVYAKLRARKFDQLQREMLTKSWLASRGVLISDLDTEKANARPV